MDKSSSRSGSRNRADLVLFSLIGILVLSFLFFRAFLPGHVLFSNDGPLGAQVAEEHAVPETFSGSWEDLNSLGYRGAGASPNITFGLLWMLGPVGYSKFFAAITLLILGLGAWTFFHQAGLAPAARVLGALAAVLNSMFLSVAAWGVAAQAITIGMMFFALAALADTSSPKRWLRVILAGFAVGMGVSEGADVGAILSLYVAAFVIYQAWTAGDLSTVRRLSLGVSRVALVAVCAALFAANLISVLVGTQIQGVAGAQQDTQTKWERWDWATQWSLPKREALGILVPGLFGYRMDTPMGLPKSMQKSYAGGQYWGAIGRDPNWYRYWDGGSQGPPPGGSLRFSGGGIYAGVMVVLVAAWAALQSFRKDKSVFSLPTRRLLWFWIAVILISLPLAFGRFAPFYQIVYALPYFSTIRNPGKFLYPLCWAIVILFAYGVHGLWRCCMSNPSGAVALGMLETVKRWWRGARGFDKNWALWSSVTVGVAALAWLIYASNKPALEKYLASVGFGDPGTASSIAEFSIRQVGWFVLLLAVAVLLLKLVLSGYFSGHRAKVGVVALGLFLLIDLGRANRPWIIAWDYTVKYASDPVIELLKKDAHTHRVASLPRWFPSVFDLPPQIAKDYGLLAQYHAIEWAQHHFLYYNIQSLDLIQLPRMPEDMLAYEMNFTPRSNADIGHIIARKWELTNTRYIIGSAAFLDALNAALDPAKKRFRIAERFALEPKRGLTEVSELQHLTAVIASNGPYAVFEFTGALPRAKLYSNWEMAGQDPSLLSQLSTNVMDAKEAQFLRHIGTNDFLTLKKLASPSFDPHKTVLLANPVPLSPTNAPAESGTVEFVSYAPKDIVLKTDAPSPAVMLLNDRYEGNWRVLVDGKPEFLLRCNYIMRGVYLPAGKHQVEFQFRPPMNSFYISLATVIVGVLLCGVLLVWRVPKPESSSEEGLGDNSPAQNAGPAKRAKQ